MILVRLLINDDLQPVEVKRWHYFIHTGGADALLCTGEVFGEGHSPAVFKIEDRKKITCERCIEMIKEFQSIKL